MSIFGKSNEFLAVYRFNTISKTLKGWFSKTVKGRLDIQFKSLEYYKDDGHSLPTLLKALKRLRPHWKLDGDNEFEKIKNYFIHLTEGSQFAVGGSNEMFVTMSPQRFMREISTSEQPPPVAEGMCRIHSNRRVSNKKRKLCASCYTKMSRLGLLNHPMNLTLLTILRRRLRHNETLRFCVNHEDLLSEPNGLCLECNTNVGLGDDAKVAKEERQKRTVDAENWDELLDLVSKQKILIKG